MDLPENLKNIVRRLQNARLELMKEQPFYAVLLLHMKFSVDSMAETLYTDGERIAFCPDFVNRLSGEELKFVLMHEVLHAALDHCGRSLREYDFDAFNTACDIVVNSNIMHSFGDDEGRISLSEFDGPSMHVAPDGKEGYEYTVEEVYKLVLAAVQQKTSGGGGDDEDENENDDSTGNPEADEDGKDGENTDDSSGDPEADEDGKNGENTDDSSGDSEKEDGKDGGGDSDGDGNGEGDDSEDGSASGNGSSGKKNGTGSKAGPGGRTDGGFDDHTFWNWDEGEGEDGCADVSMKDIWLERMVEATDVVENLRIKEGSSSRGTVPVCVQRALKDLLEPQTDWRTVLDNFVQEEITDYSFNPPDRRFQDSPFLLPDYNEKEESVKDLLFMIDTSGSMSDRMITQAYSEIKGAIDQFNGHLCGWLGFFDAAVVEPKPFADEDEFRIIRLEGGGGTSFDVIFEYVAEKMEDHLPESIIILTDGYAPFPKEEQALGIPVLWIINNRSVTPPWGKVARIRVEGENG